MTNPKKVLKEYFSLLREKDAIAEKKASYITQLNDISNELGSINRKLDLLKNSLAAYYDIQGEYDATKTN